MQPRHATFAMNLLGATLLAAASHDASAFVLFDSAAKPAAASEAKAPANFAVIPAPHGVYLLNHDTGRVAFCSNTTDAATRQAAGACAGIGAVDRSASVYVHTVSGQSLFLVHKDSGVIVQCTASATGADIQGGCAKRSALQSL